MYDSSFNKKQLFGVVHNLTHQNPLSIYILKKINFYFLPKFISIELIGAGKMGDAKEENPKKEEKQTEEDKNELVSSPFNLL